MNLNYLRYFRVLAKMEHYTKAAEELAITQPSLSHAMSTLEKELGTYLLKKMEEILNSLNMEKYIMNM